MLERDEYGFPVPGARTAQPPPPPRARESNPPSSSPPPNAEKPDHPCRDGNGDGVCDEDGIPCSQHPTDMGMAGPPGVPPGQNPMRGSIYDDHGEVVTLGPDEYGFTAASSKPSPKSAPDRSQAQRDKDAKSGVSMADGSYPIRTCGDAENARQSIGRGGHAQSSIEAHIRKREKVLGCPSPTIGGSS